MPENSNTKSKGRCNPKLNGTGIRKKHLVFTRIKRTDELNFTNNSSHFKDVKIDDNPWCCANLLDRESKSIVRLFRQTVDSKHYLHSKATMPLCSKVKEWYSNRWMWKIVKLFPKRSFDCFATPVELFF